jgi:poly-gamma-glutamate synthesis protein (capsule biosynthesis protein)
VVIVYSHWGDEYIDSSPRLRPVAKLFAEAGASAVIGSHPHVVLGHEYIGDTLVYYSLGNFIFDQYWDDDVSHGLTLMLHIGKEGRVTAEEHPTVILRDGRTCETVQEVLI